MHQQHHHHRHHHHSSHKEKRGFFSRLWHKLCSIWPWYKSLYKGRAWYIKLIVGLISFILLFATLDVRISLIILDAMSF